MADVWETCLKTKFAVPFGDNSVTEMTSVTLKILNG